jgi:murein L,D-transpeptidase YafK
MLRAAVFVAVFFVIAALAWANWPAASIGEGVKADLVVVRKSARVLELYSGNTMLKSYVVSLGDDPVGPKRAEGDDRTPEGAYVLDYRKSDSSFHRALHISYPSVSDVAQAHASGVNPGGLIMVHGLPNGLGLLGRLHRLYDWTDGCVAVTNAEIEEIWSAVADGTQIRIEP